MTGPVATLALDSARGERRDQLPHTGTRFRQHERQLHRRGPRSDLYHVVPREFPQRREHERRVVAPHGDRVGQPVELHQRDPRLQLVEPVQAKVGLHGIERRSQPG